MDGCLGSVQTYTGLLASLQAVLGTAGMPVREAWYVGDSYWRDAYCTDQSCCPLPGRPTTDILDSRLNAEMVFRGSSVGPAPEEQRPAPAAMSSEDMTRLRAAEAAWMVPLDLRRGSRAQFDALLDSWEPLFRSGQCPADPLVQGFLRASLRVPSWRDAVLVMAAAGRTAACAGADQFGIFDAACPAGASASAGRRSAGSRWSTAHRSCRVRIGPVRGVRGAGIRRGPAGPGAARAGLDQHEQPGPCPGAAGGRWRAGRRGGALRGAAGFRGAADVARMQPRTWGRRWTKNPATGSLNSCSNLSAGGLSAAGLRGRRLPGRSLDLMPPDRERAAACGRVWENRETMDAETRLGP